MNTFDDEAALNTLVAEGLHPVLAEYLCDTAIDRNTRDWPHERMMERLRERRRHFGIAEDATAPPLTTGGEPRRAYVHVVYGYAGIGDGRLDDSEPEPTMILLYDGDDVDEAIATLRARFAPTDLPVIETSARTRRLNGHPVFTVPRPGTNAEPQPPAGPPDLDLLRIARAAPRWDRRMDDRTYGDTKFRFVFIPALEIDKDYDKVAARFDTLVPPRLFFWSDRRRGSGWVALP